MFPLALLNASSPSVDPSLTLALLHFDGSNGSTTFTDSSPHNHTSTIINGSPTISSTGAEVGFGNRGSFFSGAAISIQPNFSGEFDLGDSVFTDEIRFEINSFGGYQGLICDAATGALASYFLILDTDNSSKLTALFKTTSSTYVIRHQTVPTLDTKHHAAVVRGADGYLDLYLDGIRASTRAFVGAESYQQLAPTITLGVLGTVTNYPLNGYIDEYRRRLEAVYTGNFTPPTAPFTY